MFYITVSNGLLEKKHYSNISEAIWLFLWCLDKMTIINYETGEGKVLGGKPIRFEDMEKDLGVSHRSYDRWLTILRKNGYIKTTRTPRGQSITVLKAKKVFSQRYARNVASDTPEMAHHPAKFVASNKTVSVDSNSKTPANAEIRFREDEVERPRRRIDPIEKTYESICAWAENRRGFKFVARKSQFSALKKLREAQVSISRVKDRWVELEGESWRDGFDFWDVFKSFNKRP